MPAADEQPKLEPRVFIGVCSLSLEHENATLAVVLDVTSKIRGKGTAKCIRWCACDPHLRADAERELWAAIDAALAGVAQGGGAPAPQYADVAAMCACVATREPSADLPSLLAALEARLPAAALKLVQTEAAAALASATGGDLHGACAVAAAGAEAAAFADGGARSHRTLGWGPLFMEGGGGYDLGARALMAAVKAADGRGAETSLGRAILRRLGLRRHEQLSAWAYAPAAAAAEGDSGGGTGTDSGSGGGTSVTVAEAEARIASLAPLVVEAAAAGDAVADTILRHGVGELLRAVKTAAAAASLGAAAFPVALAGPLLREGTPYTRYVAEAVADAVPGARPAYPALEPAEAAARLALRQWLALRPLAAAAAAAEAEAAPPS